MNRAMPRTTMVSSKCWQIMGIISCASGNSRFIPKTPHGTPFQHCSIPLPFERTGPGLAKDGLPKFDLTKPSQTYFDRLRDRIESAGALGIYTSIMLFEAWALKWATPDQQPWEYHVFNPDNNINAITDQPQVPDGLYPGTIPAYIHWIAPRFWNIRSYSFAKWSIQSMTWTTSCMKYAMKCRIHRRRWRGWTTFANTFASMKRPNPSSI